jgi:hypothetical protein
MASYHAMHHYASHETHVVVSASASKASGVLPFEDDGFDCNKPNDAKDSPSLSAIRFVAFI